MMEARLPLRTVEGPVQALQTVPEVVRRMVAGPPALEFVRRTAWGQESQMAAALLPVLRMVLQAVRQTGPGRQV